MMMMTSAEQNGAIGRTEAKLIGPGEVTEGGEGDGCRDGLVFHCGTLLFIKEVFSGNRRAEINKRWRAEIFLYSFLPDFGGATKIIHPALILLLFLAPTLNLCSESFKQNGGFFFLPRNTLETFKSKFVFSQLDYD